MDTKGAHKNWFRFENIWITKQTCKDVVQTAWASISKPNAMKKLLGYIDKCSAELLKWNKTTFGHVQCRINELELQLKSQCDAISQRNTLELIRNWHKKEEILWWQHACSDYLKYGDSSTQWFLSWANMRRSRHLIVGLKDDAGNWQTKDDDIGNVITQYFKNLFSTSYPSGMEEVLDCIEPKITDEVNAALCKPYTWEEVDRALIQMHSHKAPGLDGLNPFFFQHFWSSVGDDVSASVLSILHGHPIPPKLNARFVALIPKKQRPDSISEFCPTSLCNVTYKLVTKVIANCLKPFLPKTLSAWHYLWHSRCFY